MSIDSIQQAVDYIERNLHNNIRLAAISGIAGYSMYHFDKIFKYTVGDSVIEYVRKRRLTEAARELLRTTDRIIDIAVKYGFSSQQAFTLAFKTQFNMPPGQYRKNKKSLIFCEKKIITKEYIDHRQRGLTLEPKIITQPEFQVIGMEYYGANNHGEIPELWNEFFARIAEIPNKKDKTITMGICDFVHDYDPLQSKFSYLACTETEGSGQIPGKMLKKTIPAGKYAVFTHRGNADKLEDTYTYIYGAYFPKSHLRLAEKADFEVYDQRFVLNSDNSAIDIYIPIL